MNPVSRRKFLRGLTSLGVATGAATAVEAAAFADPLRLPGASGLVFHCHNLEHAEPGMMVRCRVRA